MEGKTDLLKLFIIGIVVAAAFIVLQHIRVDNTSAGKAKVTQFDTTPTSEPESREPVSNVVVSVLSNHLPSVANVETCQEMCLFEIIFEVDPQKDYPPVVPITLNRFFLVLFQAIISPNAP